MVEAGGGVENRFCGGFGIGNLEGALLDAIGQDQLQLIGQAGLVPLTDLQASCASVR